MDHQDTVASSPEVQLKKDQIIRHLRRQIVSGDWPPGTRLPTRSDLEREFSVSKDTVQKALDRLVSEEFITVKGRQGTYVAANPPHLSRYGLIFTGDATRPDLWPRFWTALWNEAISLQRLGICEMPLYYGINGKVDSEDYRHLMRDVRAHRLAGLIFTSSPHLAAHTPLLENPELPRVAIMGRVPFDIPEMPIVRLDGRGFIEKALASFQARERHRVAVLLPAGLLGAEFGEFLQASIAAHGLETRPYWIQGIANSVPSLARGVVHLMMNDEQKQRPDALLIADDNFVESAAAGLIDAGRGTPGEVDVVAHCNFPYPAHAALPVTRLGYDTRRILLACVENIAAQRRGEDVPPQTTIPALFEHELPR